MMSSRTGLPNDGLPMMTCPCRGPTRRHVAALLMGAVAASAPLRAFAAPPVPDLDAWLARHKRIGDALIWDAGKPLPYLSWPPQARAALRLAFEAAWQERPSGLPDPPANVETLTDTQFWTTSLSPSDAFALYARTVANGLALEIGGRLPWSIAQDSDAALTELLDGRAMFKRNLAPERYTVVDWDTPCPPNIARRFLVDRKLEGKDRRATIVNLIEWSWRLYHFLGGPDARNGGVHWGYRGAPPASRVVSGSLYGGPRPSADLLKPRHFTAGCHGTVGFYRTVLRALNIPVKRVPVLQRLANLRLGGHSTAFFVSEGLYLSHGDDPYSGFVRYDPSFPVARLLIDQAKFSSWFPAGVAPKLPIDSNVGRQVTELAIEEPPIYLLNFHAQDMAAGTAHEAGKVFGSLKSSYALPDLESRRLWPRLDAAVAKLGGAPRVLALFQDSRDRFNAMSVATPGG